MDIELKCSECDEILVGDYFVDDDSGITDIFIGVEPCQPCLEKARVEAHEAVQDHLAFKDKPELVEAP